MYVETVTKLCNWLSVTPDGKDRQVIKKEVLEAFSHKAANWTSPHRR